MFFNSKKMVTRIIVSLILITIIAPFVSAYTANPNDEIKVMVLDGEKLSDLNYKGKDPYTEIDKNYFNYNGYALSEDDYLKQNFNAETNTLTFEIVRVKIETVTESEVIDRGTISTYNDELEKGTSKVIRDGNDGVKTSTYTIRYENGVETSKVLTAEIIDRKPVDKIVEYGTKVITVFNKTGSAVTGSTIVTAGGKELTFRNVITASATAYDLSYESCGKNPGDRGYGITASGMQARYGVVAVDPRVIPLGTRLYIEAADGSWVYGEAIAGDTGGAIKGNKVDLFFNSRSECMAFGRRTAKIYILD